MNGFEKLEIVETLSKEEYASSKVLAKGLSIGEKTLRGRILQINQELDNQVAYIEMKRGAGYKLNVFDEHALLNWKEKLLEKERKEIPSSTSERIDYILFFLLNHKEYIKREMLCEFLYISEKTVSQDLKGVGFILKQYDIVIEKKPHHGLRAVGSEFSKRQCIMNHYLIGGNTELLNKQEVKKSIAEISDIVLELIQKEELYFSELTLKRFIDYIYVTEHRIKHGFVIKEYDKQKVDDQAVDVAKRIMETLRDNKIPILLTKEEIYYMAIYLKGSRMYEPKMNGTSNFVISQETDKLSQEMLESVYQAYQIDFRTNFTLRMYVNKHLVSLELRLQYGIEIKNPILSEVKKSYLFSYLMAQQACIPINNKYHKKISEDEIAYFAMLFEVEKEQQNYKIEKKNILLVCATGKTSSRFLQLTLSKQFHEYINQIELCSLYELDSHDVRTYDYVFSTVPINKTIPVPIIMIHDFITQSEILMVKNRFDDKGHYFYETFFKKELFFTEIEGNKKEDVLQTICNRIKTIYPLPDAFYESVLYRETLGNTDFGNLTAIPHPYEKVLHENLICVAILKNPIIWGENSVQLVILSSFSEKMNADIKQYFELTSKLLLRKDLIERIIKGRDYKTFQMCLEEILHTQ